ncbi:MAG: hypothetical protein M1833_004862 [Piccolia ochrophora]|nr:MAG: hypothetical protein M1833_004862 [Piccolia ochrophora]
MAAAPSGRRFAYPQEVPASSTEEQQAPLLGSGKDKGATKEPKVSYLSLPKKMQLAVLCIARMADPLTSTSIQSYMFYQLKFFEPTASDARLSTQAGIIVGAKTAAQVCTGMLWGRLADSDWGGRKTVLMIGLLSSCISSIGHGFSTTFWAAVAWQVFGGAMSSNVAITRCVVAELNPEKRYRTRALLLLPLCASAGMLLGPLVGGLLSPVVEGKGPHRAYPYAPPNICIAAIDILAAIGVFWKLEETLESLRDTEGSFARRKLRQVISYFSRTTPKSPAYVAVAGEEQNASISEVELPPTSSAANARDITQVSTRGKPKGKLAFHRIWTFNVLCTLLAQFIIAGHLSTFANLWAIFLSTAVASPGHQHPPFKFTGGLGMPPREVGFALSTLGAVGVVLQLAIYPTLNDRFGTVKIWRGALFVFPIVYVVAPFPSLAASTSSAAGSTAVVWLAMGSVLLLFVVGRTGVTPATTLLINDCTPHPSVRGTIHTSATVTGNLSRSIFPVVALALFGEGLRIGVVGLGFWCLAGLASLACVASRWVTEGSNGKDIVLEGDEEEPETIRGPSEDSTRKIRRRS